MNALKDEFSSYKILDIRYLRLSYKSGTLVGYSDTRIVACVFEQAMR